MPHSNEEVDTIIVGAGPVGLLTAIGLLKKDPERKLVLFEKHPQYSRTHVVRVKRHLLQRFADQLGEPAIEKLTALIKRLRSNPNIRTTLLEQSLREIVLDLGGEITHKEIKNVDSDFTAYSKATLIIGADGTHSLVSQQVFGTDNFVKYPFDHVLQIRFEIAGSGSVSPIDNTDLIKYMQSYGVVASEYIGKTEDDKTPVTLQFMIAKTEFDRLSKQATSKNPIKYFNAAETTERVALLPASIVSQINGYLGLRIRHFTRATQTILLNDVKISVNEAPATRSKKIFKPDGDRIYVLVGDASLGLSYFKGLNAGIESNTRLIDALTSKDTNRNIKLSEFSSWFDNVFAPGKIGEVSRFSRFVIAPSMALFYGLNQLLDNNLWLNQAEANRTVKLYLSALTNKTATDSNTTELYPHRDDVYWNPVLSFLPAPMLYGKQAIKYFVDWTRPYKSIAYVIRDLMQPLTAAYHFVAGALKIALAIPIAMIGIVDTLVFGSESVTATLQNMTLRLANGLEQIALGGLLALSTALMPLKLISRGIITAAYGKPNIEENVGFKKIIQRSQQDNLSTHEKNALLVDLHRKFEKSKKEVRVQPLILTLSRSYTTNTNLGISKVPIIILACFIAKKPATRVRH